MRDVKKINLLVKVYNYRKYETTVKPILGGHSKIDKNKDLVNLVNDK